MGVVSLTAVTCCLFLLTSLGLQQSPSEDEFAQFNTDLDEVLLNRSVFVNEILFLIVFIYIHRMFVFLQEEFDNIPTGGGGGGSIPPVAPIGGGDEDDVVVEEEVVVVMLSLFRLRAPGGVSACRFTVVNKLYFVQ